MYNGIGLQTARGSGTNGYVQRNLSAVRKQTDRIDYKSEEELKKLEAQFSKKPNKDILEHDRKRQVEVKCLEMQDLMEEQGFSEEDIEAKVTQFRKLLMEKEAVSDSVTVLKDDFGRPIATETHQIALATEEKNARLRDAFGIEPREEEKQSFGGEMERWEDEAEDVRRKDKKKKHRHHENDERKDESKEKKQRHYEDDERKDERKKHRKHRSDESPKSRHSRKSQSPKRRHESPKRRHRSDSEEKHRSKKKR